MSTRKKSPWKTWLPTAILGVAIVGIVGTAMVLLNNGLAEPAGPADEDQVTDLNWSKFDDRGLEYVSASRLVRIDMSQPPISASELGLPDDGVLEIEPVDNVDVTLDYKLILRTGGEEPGGVGLAVTRFELETAGGELVEVRAEPRGSFPFRDALATLQGEAELYGWDTSSTDQIFQDVEAAIRAGEGFSFSFGPAGRLGAQFTGTATCDPSAYCQLTYTATPSMG